MGLRILRIKWSAMFMLLPVFLILSIIASYATNLAQPAANKIIIIDAGHGGIDSGANRPGIAEKDINLALALELKEVLNREGAKVVLTRDSDTSLEKFCDNEKVRGRYHRDLAARLETVAESDADLYVSIHANVSSDSKRSGAETFYYAKSPAGKSLAEAIQSSLGKITTAAAKPAPGDYFVLRRNTVPAVLIEIGYITNQQERRQLQSAEYRRQIAEAIAGGIREYCQQSL